MLERHIFPCGGETQKKSAPDVTEAGLIKKYLSGKKSYYAAYTRYHLEEDSYTTLDNLKNVARYIKENFVDLDPRESQIVIICGYGCHPVPELTKYLDCIAEDLRRCDIRPGITIWCESSRKFKVKVIASWYFFWNFIAWPGDLKIRTVSWEKPGLFQFFSSLGEIAALVVPGLARWGRNKRIKRSYSI